MGDWVTERLAEPGAAVFIFAADAMAAYGIESLGVTHGRPRTRPQFLQLLREFVADGAIDGLLMTPADAEVLALDEKLFEHSPVTPIVRMNAETGIWNPRFGSYRGQHSLPFPVLPLADAGFCESVAACRVGIGLYSLTLDNDVAHDDAVLQAYLRFAREVGRAQNFAHFLEVFLPNTNRRGMSDEQCGAYVADSIARLSSYLRRAERPLLIKTEYTAPKIWRQLCDFDPTLRIGALGGPRQGPRQTLLLAHEVVKNGGRAVLFGRTIFEEDDPLAMARALRRVLDGKATPDQAHDGYRQALKS